MILVAGAAGVLGSEIVRRLADRGEDVRALVRITSAPEKVERFHQTFCCERYHSFRRPGPNQSA